MEQVWFLAILWLALALAATLLAIWLRISTALSEIVVGTVAQLIIGAIAGSGAVTPTVIANAWFMPRHLLPEHKAEMAEEDVQEMP
jgi:hypothetical protein